MTKRNTGVLWSVEQHLNADEKEIAQDNMGLDTLYSGANSDNAGKYVKRVYRDSNGKIVTVQSDTNSSFNYNDPGTAPINGVGVKSAIDSITVKVDDDTAALNRLMVTSKNNDAIFGNNFFSGLKKVSPAGHPEYSYVSVNCGEGLFVDGTTSSDSFGKLRISKATSDSLGGIRVGYTSSGDNIAVQLNNNGQGYVTVPISDIESEIAALRVFSSISVNEGGTGAFVISPTNNNSTLKLTTDGNITLTQPTSITDTIQLNYTLPAATSSVLGGIKTGFASTLTDERYAVQLTNENKAYVTVDDMFKLNEVSYPTHPNGVHMNLTCSSPTNGAAISITNRSGALVNWPSKSASADPIGYLLPPFATGTTGKRLVLDNGSVKWADDATVYTAGTDIKIFNNKISVNTTGTTSATNAFVIGDDTTASGTNSFAGGTSSKATNSNTFAFGANNTVSGHDSIALGSSNNVLGAYSTAIGHYHVIPAYENNAGGTIAIGMNLNCTYPGVIYMGNHNTGESKEYGAVRVTGQGYTQAGGEATQTRDIELLYGDGLLELYSGYRTTSYILSGGNGSYSTIQSSYQVLGRGKSEYKSGFTPPFYSPLLHIEDRYTKRETPNEARIISSTLSRDGLVVNAYDEIGGTEVAAAYIARYTPEQIEFESSTCGVNILIPETPKVPAWSGSMTSDDMSAARIALKSVQDKWANLKTGTISVRFFRASELTQQHPLIPSEEEGELTFIYNDYTAGSVSEFYIWDRYTTKSDNVNGPEKKSGYITQNNFCLMLTVEASQNIGQQGSFIPGVFALLTSDSEAQAASDPTVVVGFGSGYSNPTSYDDLSSVIGFSNNKVVKMFIIDNQLQVPADMQLTAYYAGTSVVNGRNSYYFQCCGHLYRCDYDATSSSHTKWEKEF